MAALAMFPLESVLVPGMVLPLHVFEERYRALIRHCMDSPDREFGVSLIERGSEVGGGDVRSTVGTVAQIVQAEEFDDGRFGVVAVGTRRIRITSWLPDDPYPRAEVEDWPDESSGSEQMADLQATYAERTAQLRRVLAMAVELGQPASPMIELGDDPVAGSYHLGVLAPIGPLDRQRLLAAPGPVERLAKVGEFLAEAAADLEAQLAGG